MKALILVHSSTGNTRLVAEYAAARLARAGAPCALHPVTHQTERPSLDGVDLLGVAFPAMYFRPTLVIERIVDNLPTPPRGTPAFVLATAGGGPGAALPLMVEQLTRKGFVVVGAHWVLAPSNWPPQLALVRQPGRLPLVGRLHGAVEGALTPLWRRWPGLRGVAGSFWESAAETAPADRERLDRFLDGVLGAALAVHGGAHPAPPDLREAGAGWARLAGRYTDPRVPAASSRLRVLAKACTRCGACVRACPSDCLRADAQGLPHFHEGCTGCWACYNACPHAAIAARATPAGRGRYEGPSAAMRDLLQC